MQILPTTRQEAMGDHLFGSLNSSTEEGSTSFADELLRLQSAQKAVDEGSRHSVSAAMAAEQQSTAPLVEAPYSRNTTDGVTYTVEEVCFTKQDLQELRQKMEQAGAPAEALTGLDKLVQQPDGATLSQVVASLHQSQTPPTLSENDVNTLKSLCERIDSTGKLGTNVLDLLAKGQGKQALELLTQTMGQMPAGTRLDVDKDEMAVLGRALGLSTNAQKQLQGNFGPYSGVSLTAADFSSFMSPASFDFVQRDVNQKKLDKALDATLNPILKKAKTRMEAEKAASELSSRRAEQSKTLIQKTMLQNVNSTLENTQASQAQQAGQNGQATQIGKTAAQAGQTTPGQATPGQTPQVGQTPQAGQTTPTAQAGQATGTQENMRQALAGHAEKRDSPLDEKLAASTTDKLSTADKGKPVADTAQAPQGVSPSGNVMGKEVFTGEHGTQNKDARNSKDSKGDKKDEGWEQLLGKTEVRASTAPTTQTATTTPLVGMAGAHPAGAANTALENLAAANGGNERTHISRQVASQVEQSMLSALRDGTKRLELQLHPGELGNLTLSLTMRNGEVSATIRSEKGETTDLINRQLDALRANLEQQGIKVDKLEVQTQLADGETRQQWEGMQQHNARQEENARRDDMERLRNLGRVRNSSTNLGEITLEQGVQLDMRTAGNAAQGIYIVA